MNPSESELRAQLDVLQRELSSRQSIVHFAHSGISTVLVVIIVGAGLKLLWDSPDYWYIGTSVALAGAATAVYAVIQYFLGRRHLRRELDSFQALQSTRHALKLDDPDALLPS